MRDALQAVYLVLGVAMLVGAAVGFLRGELSTTVFIAGIAGAVAILIVAVLPRGIRHRRRCSMMTRDVIHSLGEQPCPRDLR
jgi:hypothetical protein